MGDVDGRPLPIHPSATVDGTDGLGCRSPAHFLLHHLLQRERVESCVSGLIIVEINVDASQLGAPLDDAFRPLLQDFVAVAALIFSAWSVQADVGPIGRDLDGGMEACKFINTKCRVVLAKEFVYRINQPGWLQEFEGVAMVLGKSLEES